MELTYDKIRVLEAVERHGVIQKLVRSVRVSGMDSSDYTALTDALDTVTDVHGDQLSETDNLVLTKRHVRAVDKTLCDVILTYEHFVNEGQDLGSPVQGVLTGEMRANIQQRTTNLNADGNQITVSHTWPDTDDDWPGETVTQSGEISIYEAQKTFTIEGIKMTSRPVGIANRIVGKVNASWWANGAPRTWMCTACNWKPYDIDTARCYMTFEFQHNVDSWDPDVYFIDSRTGNPPADLVEDVGYKKIEYHDSVSFDAIIGAYVRGA